MTTQDLAGTVALITGSSRGIGAATAALLAARGATIIVNYREKAKRAERVVADIQKDGGTAVALQGDITDEASLEALFAAIDERFGGLDLLVLNASGGMEKGMAPDYALRLNRDAQVSVLQHAIPLLRRGGRVLYVTSHQAHFIRAADTLPEYRPVAESKRAGEDALRQLIPNLDERGIGFVVVSGDMIVGTVTATLLDRHNPGALKERESQVGKLYTVDEFAAQIADAATATIPDDHTILVGDTSAFGA